MAPDQPLKIKVPETSEDLEQFRSYRDFAEKHILPLFESTAAEIKPIVEQMLDLETRDSWTVENIDSLAEKITGIKENFRSALSPLLATIRRNFGPVISMRANILAHNSLKIFTVLHSRLRERWANAEGEPEKMNVKSLVPHEELISQYNFSKKFILSIATPPREIYKGDKEMRSIPGSGLDFELRFQIDPIEKRFETIPIEFNMDVPENIRGEVLPYEALLMELIKELAVNAGEIEGVSKIDIRIRKEDQKFVIEVEDNGPGIPQENLSRIFEKGFTTKATGTGQGLYFIREAVEKIIKGTIGVVSEKGKTVFKIEITDKVNT